MRRATPLRSFVLGALAGAAGSFVQNIFFKATAKIAPRPPEDAFEPPEPEQRHERPTETVARRFVEDVLERGPLDEEDRRRAHPIVHYTFGSMWGAAYGFARESVPMLSSLPGALGWSTVVWAVSDDLILPAFRLSGWPQDYPLKNHLYAWVAHVVYGVTVWGAYRALRAEPWLGAVGAFTIARRTRRLPAPVREQVRPILRRVGALRRDLAALEMRP